MHFEKWHGLGNDFIVTEQALGTELVRRLCDRRRGVGADGVLVVRREADASVRMVIVNADGSRPEMCGNGLRCVAGYFAERGGLSEGTVLVRTPAGERRCEVRRQGGRFEVGAAMGLVRVGEHLLFAPPAAGPSDPAAAEPARDFVRVDVGNPHAVTFDPWDDAAVDRVGPALERAVPGGTNVELCRVSEGGRRIEV
ncbi:MAG: diaminopimelate epimerase, partial [Polyangiaceae bacterium]|nr:diaminopimelate epimerase [Polyangiaceae bacterium]